MMQKAIAKHRCGACLLFQTPKCPFLYSPKIEREPKQVTSWKEWINWLFTVNTDFPQRKGFVRNMLLSTDSACAHFIPER